MLHSVIRFVGKRFVLSWLGFSIRILVTACVQTEECLLKQILIFDKRVKHEIPAASSRWSTLSSRIELFLFTSSKLAVSGISVVSGTISFQTDWTNLNVHPRAPKNLFGSIPLKGSMAIVSAFLSRAWYHQLQSRSMSSQFTLTHRAECILQKFYPRNLRVKVLLLLTSCQETFDDECFWIIKSN